MSTHEGSGLAVRRLGPDDWRTYRAVRLEMLLGSPEAFGSTSDDALLLDEVAWRERLVAVPTLLAELHGTPVGSVGLAVGPGDDEPDVAHLIAMYVAPASRGGGVGEALVRAALGWARAQGRSVVRLEVTSGNRAARALYERAGFRMTGVTRPHPRRAELHQEQMECRPQDAGAAGPG